MKDWRHADPHLLVLAAIVALPVAAAVLAAVVMSVRALLRLAGAI